MCMEAGKEASMYIQKRKNKEGTYYSFSYLDENGRRIRLKRSEHPHFTKLEDAQAWAKSQEAYKASMKAKIEQRLSWKKKYYQFDELLEKYLKYQKKQAPNSWRNSRIYMEHYVLHFFLEIKKANNVNTWHILFNEFCDWLEEDALTTRTEQQISYSTANHVIRTLNTFATFLTKYNLMNPENNITCPAFPESKLNYKDFSDVIEEDEFTSVHFKLKQINPAAADFFHVLYKTGMRFNELFSLPMSSLFSGELEGPIHEEMTTHKLKYYGYIILESQCSSQSRVREKDGTLKRKPLKGRRSIHPKNNRTIPLADKTSWNILARRYKVQKELFNKREFGPGPTDYLLFDDLKYNDAVRALRQAYEDLRREPKSFHCCRHSYATYLVGRTRSYFLARAVLGHRSDAFDRYNHIYEQIALKAKQKVQEIDEIA